jgi:hypothetical protein
MSKGLKVLKSTDGRVTGIQVSAKTHPKLVEDLIDGMEMEKARKEPSTDWEVVKKKLQGKPKTKAPK